MTTDTFPRWLTRVRKDPLGANGYSALLSRFAWAQSLLAKEHLLADGAVGTAGEHNAAEIPREVGSCYITAGPTGNAQGFRYATGATRSAGGTMQLAINSALYPFAEQIALQVQNCSEAGITKPAITSAKIISTSQIEFYSKSLTSGLGAGNAWAVDDANLCVAIHGPPLRTGLGGVQGIAKAKGDWLTEDAADWNAQVQADLDLRSKFLEDGIGGSHSAAGDHLCREVAKTFADVYYSGGAYRIRSTSSRNALAASTLGTGICRLTNTTPWTLSAQPFVMTNYAASNGGLVTDMYANSTPRSLITTTTIDIYLYKYDQVAKTWAHADTDFFLTVHAG